MMITQYRSTSSPPPPSKMLTISTLELASRLTLMLASILTWGRGEGGDTIFEHAPPPLPRFNDVKKTALLVGQGFLNADALTGFLALSDDY